MDKTINTNIEILGKYYSIRCPESELPALQEAATYLNKRMKEVEDSGKAINLERIAIMAALNITYELLQSQQQRSSIMAMIHQKIEFLQSKIDAKLEHTLQAELLNC